jgi:hypothetical protein
LDTFIAIVWGGDFTVLPSLACFSTGCFFRDQKIIDRITGVTGVTITPGATISSARNTAYHTRETIVGGGGFTVLIRIAFSVTFPFDKIKVVCTIGTGGAIFSAFIAVWEGNVAILA